MGLMSGPRRERRAHGGATRRASPPANRWDTARSVWPGEWRRKRARSDVAVTGIADHREALDELRDSRMQRHLRLVAGRLDLFVRHDVVALVRILADRRFQNDEVGHLLPDGVAQLHLGDVRVGQAD